MTEDGGLLRLPTAFVIGNAANRRDQIVLRYDLFAGGIEFRNFGVFEVMVRKPRVGRNPNAPRKTVEIPERVVVKFKPGKIMRQRVMKLDPKRV